MPFNALNGRWEKRKRVSRLSNLTYCMLETAFLSINIFRRKICFKGYRLSISMRLKYAHIIRRQLAFLSISLRIFMSILVTWMYFLSIYCLRQKTYSINRTSYSLKTLNIIRGAGRKKLNTTLVCSVIYIDIDYLLLFWKGRNLKFLPHSTVHGE